jgi:hypothetical protein
LKRKETKACTQKYVDYVVEQINNAGLIEGKKNVWRVFNVFGWNIICPNL